MAGEASADGTMIEAAQKPTVLQPRCSNLNHSASRNMPRKLIAFDMLL